MPGCPPGNAHSSAARDAGNRRTADAEPARQGAGPPFAVESTAARVRAAYASPVRVWRRTRSMVSSPETATRVAAAEALRGLQFVQHDRESRAEQADLVDQPVAAVAAGDHWVTDDRVLTVRLGQRVMGSPVAGRRVAQPGVWNGPACFEASFGAACPRRPGAAAELASGLGAFGEGGPSARRSAVRPEPDRYRHSPRVHPSRVMYPGRCRRWSAGVSSKVSDRTHAANWEVPP